MYAVIKTGGKQYRVKAGDLLVVEKLDGEAGANVTFNEVLLLGEGADVVVGSPTVDGASVTGALIETRKGQKVKIFKKIRRQGYRRTKGHRQLETVVRVTSVAGAVPIAGAFGYDAAGYGLPLVVHPLGEHTPRVHG